MMTRNLSTPHTLSTMFALCLMPLLFATVGQAQTTWTMPTEYPATAMPGEGLSFFVSAIEKRLAGKLVIKPSFAAEMKIKSAAMPAAVAAGTIQAGDAFGGALGAKYPPLALPSLPFLAVSIGDAKRLSEIARPLYEKTFADMGLKLLYTTPWPPSGIWSKEALAGAASLDGLAIRTYDATSSTVLTAAGAKASNLSFADVMPKLKDGSINAVLSSGDGGAGRKLWDYLPNFTAVNYAVPLSFAFVANSAFEALPMDQRKAVEEAARETEARQWAAIEGRLAKNYAQMRANKVNIVEAAPTDLVARLQKAATASVDAWTKSSGEQGQAALKAFRAR